MAKKPSVLPLADRILKGRLTERLRQERAEDRSFEQIARGLAADGIDVSGETVRKWCIELGLHTVEPELGGAA